MWVCISADYCKSHGGSECYCPDFVMMDEDNPKRPANDGDGVMSCEHVDYATDQECDRCSIGGICLFTRFIADQGREDPPENQCESDDEAKATAKMEKCVTCSEWQSCEHSPLYEESPEPSDPNLPYFDEDEDIPF